MKLAEISKVFKIYLLALVVLGLAFSIVYLFPDLYHAWTASPWNDPGMTRVTGITLLVLAIFDIAAVLRKEWVQIRIIIEFATVWLIAMGILNLLQAADPDFAPYPQLITSNAILAVICLAMSAITILFYLKEQKKSKS